MKKIGPAIYPFGDEDRITFDKLPRGKSLRAEITQPRNLEFLRLYWALCTRVGEGVGKDAEFIDWSFKMETGRFDMVRTMNGTTVPRVHSISFENMPDETAFRNYFNEITVVLYEKWGIDPASVADLLLPRGMDQR